MSGQIYSSEVDETTPETDELQELTTTEYVSQLPTELVTPLAFLLWLVVLFVLATIVPLTIAAYKYLL